MNILVSACLLGVNCRYDGKNHYQKQLEKLAKFYSLIPVCPEQLGGLSTPREPVELKKINGRTQAMTKNNVDLTENFQRGAEEARKIAKMFNCTLAILKSKSPSCGLNQIYSGNFDDNIIEGNGLTAQLLLDEHLSIYTEKSLSLLLQELEI